MFAALFVLFGLIVAPAYALIDRWWPAPSLRPIGVAAAAAEAVALALAVPATGALIGLVLVQDGVVPLAQIVAALVLLYVLIVVPASVSVLRREVSPLDAVHRACAPARRRRCAGRAGRAEYPLRRRGARPGALVCIPCSAVGRSNSASEARYAREEDRPRTADPAAVHARPGEQRRVRPARAHAHAPRRPRRWRTRWREDIARRQGVDRRRFLQGMGGIAVTLAAINIVGCDSKRQEDAADRRHRRRNVRRPDRRRSRRASARRWKATSSSSTCRRTTSIPQGPWVQGEPGDARNFFRAFRPGLHARRTSSTASAATTTRTTSSWRATRASPCSRTRRPSATPSDPLNFDEMKRTRDIMNDLSPEDTGRLRLHSVVVPNVGPRAGRSSTACRRAPKRWTSRRGRSTRRTARAAPAGSSTTRALGIPVIEKARDARREDDLRAQGAAALRVRRRARVAARHRRRREGVSRRELRRLPLRLVPRHARRARTTRQRRARRRTRSSRACSTTASQPNANVYAEMGSTWRNIMSDTTQAAHVLGKLLKYVGEDNVLWGTDCIWTGSPQPQIVAFRTFKMDPQFAAAVRLPGSSPTRSSARSSGSNAARLYGVDPVEAALQDRAATRSSACAWPRTDMEGDTHELRYMPRNPTAAAASSLVRGARRPLGADLARRCTTRHNVRAARRAASVPRASVNGANVSHLRKPPPRCSPLVSSPRPHPPVVRRSERDSSVRGAELARSRRVTGRRIRLNQVATTERPGRINETT